MTGQFFLIILGILHSEMKKNEYAAQKARHSLWKKTNGKLMENESFQS